MTFPESGWIKYIDTLSAINKTAAQKFVAYLNAHDVSTAAGKKAAIDYAYALSTRYGEMAAAASCEMYDAVAEASGVILPAAEPAATATYGEVAKMYNGMKKQNMGNEAMGNGVGRLVKRAGADTVLQNAKRDGAEFAWVPHGDTCSFCLMLASNGWQPASKKTIKGDHAEHIHANCDCTFAIRFDGKSEVEGYDPDKYREMYDNADGNTWQEKLNSMRRDEYAANADKIRAQKREAYKKTNARLTEETSQDKINNNNSTFGITENEPQVRIPAIPASTITEKVQSGEYSLRLTVNSYNKHVEGHPDYERYKESRKEKGLPPQGVLTISKEEAQQIINEKSGTGIINVKRDGTPTNVEDITCDHVIGKCWYQGKYYETNKAAIHHGSKGSHLVPHFGGDYD